MAFFEEEGTLSFLVRSAWLGLRTEIGGVLRAHGLTTPQYATLMIVEENPGATNSDVARKVASSRQAANEMLAGLDRDGLITRSPHPTDRRAQQIQITEAGAHRLAAARIAVARREAEIMAAVSPELQLAIRSWMSDVAELCGES